MRRCRTPARRRLVAGLMLCLLAPWTAAVAGAAVPPSATAPDAPPAAPSVQGSEIYQRFVDGLSDRDCSADTSDRWRRHFGHVPRDLANQPDKLLPLFGYVIDQLQAHHLPTEYALIPFVESGYRPGARSNAGPAGLWQFIARTARNHNVAIRPGYDGRLSPVDSTQAAVRYLKTLHGMFAGDWRLAVMGYNAGEYRVFGALKQAGQRAADARPEDLPMPQTTKAYVSKLQALSCLLVEAGEREEWLQAIDHTVPVLAPAPLPRTAGNLDSWASRQGHDPDLIRRMNPAFPEGRVASADRELRVLAPAVAVSDTAPDTVLAATEPRDSAAAPAAAVTASAPTAVVHYAEAIEPPRSHVVARGDSIWRIARRYGVGVAQLLARNGLTRDSVLRPGTILLIDDVLPGALSAASADRSDGSR